MACGMCGGTPTNPRRYEVTVTDTGEKYVFLSETEARVFASAQGGGTINILK